MKKVAVVTGTRADYGLLYWVIKAIDQSDDFELQLLVCGTHLIESFGKTRDEIVKDGFTRLIDVSFPYPEDTRSGMSRATGEAVIAFTEAYDKLSPDLMIVLGDRYEAFAATQAAALMAIPVAHLHGGELTEGAIDDCLRHAMTKLSRWHFVATDEYRQRVIQMGESPDSVFNVGATGLETLLNESLLTKEELLSSLPLKTLSKPTFLVTFHPETMGSGIDGFFHLTQALDRFDDVQVLFTAPNIDSGGQDLLDRTKCYVAQRSNAYFVESLGRKRYLSILQYVDCVIGNSSSGVIEVPSFHLPTVNIGTRQKGRLSADSVIHCGPDCDSIVESIDKAMSESFKSFCKTVVNPYGQGQTSDNILKILRRLDWSAMELGKAFHDVEFFAAEEKAW